MSEKQQQKQEQEVSKNSTANKLESIDPTTVDSGYLSSGDMRSSEGLSYKLSSELSTQNDSSNSHHRSQFDSGIVDDHKKGTSRFHCDNVLLNSTQSLSEKLSNLNLCSKEINRAHLSRISETKKRTEDFPWNIYYEQDEGGDTHLHLAIVHGFVEVAYALIRATPHPRLLDTPNDASQTPLHLAVETGQYQIARWLIIAGARPSPRDLQGNSPLHIAARLGDLNLVKAITDPINAKCRKVLVNPPSHYEKPKLDQWNYLGQACIHVAAQNGNIKILKHLIDCGADINAREGLKGWTVLHYAVENGDKTMAELILPKCNIEVRTYNGLSAFQLCPYVSEDIRLCLQNHGVDSPYTSDEDDDEDDECEMVIEADIASHLRPHRLNNKSIANVGI
ncbi:hypothetical protein ABEB36_012955 [Hypothenemus hampei]|uniref:Uncharacterized protein n=1 Tax=Hypothenemus hampei TaxID=57062 RepID=A0ABD1E759_HYPHA